MTTPFLNLVVALQCEAKPLIKHFGLKRHMQQNYFSIYDKGSITLTVSGLGKTSMAAAAAYTQALFGSPEHSVWLNIGVAGHQSHSIGRMFIAHKIVDKASKRSWYPPILFDPSCSSSELATVSRPETEYAAECLYDMEASGFYPTALRFSTSELVQCLKIVSDNDSESRAKVDPTLVSSLVDANLVTIEDIGNRLKEMAQSFLLKQPGLLAEFLNHWHFTGHQMFRLKQSLRQWDVVSPNAPPNLDDLHSFKSAKEVLFWLKNRLDNFPITIE